MQHLFDHAGMMEYSLLKRLLLSTSQYLEVPSGALCPLHCLQKCWIDQTVLYSNKINVLTSFHTVIKIWKPSTICKFL